MPRKPSKRSKEPGMVLVKRVVRPMPSLIVTDDGYRYEWPEGGEAVDVLEHHRRMVLAVKDARLVEVELADEPVIVPAFDTTPPIEIALVPPPAPEQSVDLSDATITDVQPFVPEPLVLATVPPAEPEPDVDLCGCDVEEAVLPPVEPLPVATLAPADPEPQEPLTPVVGHLWSDADRVVAGV